MDPAENYHVLEFKFNYQKKLVPFTVIWTKNRLILLEISQKRKEIVGSYNVKYSAS
jgi:tRNA(Met) C34 N-acetyltransferase TmcA